MHRLGDACIVSEPMNTDDYQTACSDSNERIDFADSVDYEATQAWTRCDRQRPVSTPIPMWGCPRVTKSSGMSCASIQTVSITCGIRALNCPREITASAPAFTADSATIIGGSIGVGPTSSRSTGGSQTAIQLSDGGTDTGRFDLWAGGMAEPPSGDKLSPAGDFMSWRDCVDNWCRMEICISSPVDIRDFDAITLDGYVEQVGVSDPLRREFPATFVGDGEGGLSEIWVATAYREACTGSPDEQGYTYFSHAMVAAWSEAAEQTIGPAVEVEGGGAPPPMTGMDASPDPATDAGPGPATDAGLAGSVDAAEVSRPEPDARASDAGGCRVGATAAGEPATVALLLAALAFRLRRR